MSPAGMFASIRMIPVFVDIAKDIMRLCPKAYFFNFSNPMTTTCLGVKKATGFPMIGLCHGVKGMQKILSEEFAGIDDKKVSNYAVGVNHMTLMTEYLYEGKDAWHILQSKLDEKRKNGEEITEPFGWEMFETYGGRVYPLPGDGHAISFFPEKFAKGDYYGKKIGVDIFKYGEGTKNREEAFKRDMELAYSTDPLPGYIFEGLAGYREEILEIIGSMEQDQRRVFSVNMTNGGAIPNLPKDAILELPAAATAKGLLPLQINDFPDVFAGIITRLLIIADLVVEAALKGDKKLFVEAVVMGGFVTERSAAEKMVSEVLASQKKYLSQF